MSEVLRIKLHPRRFPNMSEQMAAGLDAAEWDAFAALLRGRVGLALDAPGSV